MLAKLALSCHKGPLPADNNYLTYIGMLMYASLGTRPDICYATQYLAQFSNCHGNNHLTAMKRVFQYLKGTADCCITYGGLAASGEVKETGYVDANWGLDIIN
ncbi:hypothetical protein OPQ81_011077 [Rhizoctonia solani]|nr:hypothetical protein OPQ81_011077 [Rhizoctonia solani]